MTIKNKKIVYSTIFIVFILVSLYSWKITEKEDNTDEGQSLDKLMVSWRSSYLRLPESGFQKSEKSIQMSCYRKDFMLTARFKSSRLLILLAMSWNNLYSMKKTTRSWKSPY
ncbi:hypothetical protein ACFLSA_00700 [Bacteroidota bacterium]